MDDDDLYPAPTAAVGRLITSWFTEPAAAGAHDRDLGTGLAVRDTDAATFIREAQRLALAAPAGAVRPAPSAELLAIAEALVVDEHPSVDRWTESERDDALYWVAVVIDRFGEDGVQRLLAALDRVPPAAG